MGGTVIGQTNHDGSESCSEHSESTAGGTGPGFGAGLRHGWTQGLCLESVTDNQVEGSPPRSPHVKSKKLEAGPGSHVWGELIEHELSR